MSLLVTKITLFSHSPQDLATFLAEILDCEMAPLEEGILVDYESFALHIYPSNTEKTFHNMQLDLSLGSEEELKDLLQKVEFYHYRHNSKESIPTLESSRNEASFILKDLDGRSWRFYYRTK